MLRRLLAAVLLPALTVALVRGDAVATAGPAPAPLPTGGLATDWEVPIGEFDDVALDEGSGSVTMLNSDFDGGLNEMQVLATYRGTRRWGGKTDGVWVRHPDGRVASTGTGIAFLTTDDFRIFAVRLSTGRLAWKSELGLGTATGLDGDLLVLNVPGGDGAVAVEAETGVKRWEWTPDGECVDARTLFGDGALTADCGGVIVRVSLADGTVRWTRPAAAGCEVHDLIAGAGFAALTEICGKAQRLVVLDGVTGAVRASRDVQGDPDEPENGLAYLRKYPAGKTALIGVSTEHGVLFRATDASLFPLSGGQIPAEPDSGTTPDGILLERENGGQVELSLVDPVTGGARWKRELPFAGTRLSYGVDAGYQIRPDGGVLYLTGLVPTLWPGVVVLIDQRSGEMTMAATGRAGVKVAGVLADGSMLLQSGAYEKGRLARIRFTGGETGFLGTPADPGRWPDACALLSADDYQDAYPGVVAVAKGEPVGRRDAALPVPARCRFLPPSISGTEVTVAVGWMFPDAAEAEKAVELQDPYGRDPARATVGAAGRPALRWDDISGDGSENGDHHRLSFAVGRCLASVSAIGDTTPLQRLADTVADRLADPDVAAGCSA
ncbi:hypothetical protein ACTI_73920 [Actinoplanes sp. OR16]|uniref:outer membrane protein assembly factor BamB family protein n=1 Tax=Actinoplanes sp. OR16 TaxID=946334 RepID=UPI000F70594A|nr:PQQ-binding-like beta-propeller repeat protein [Actinoplanes sp. OR16]BBH70707.1 hypothetical protein ACTI_73920 [Actinoplanes sp. OR16]